MADGREHRIVIAGAGSIGCYVGGSLAQAGRDVTLYLREGLAGSIREHGFDVSDMGGSDHHLAPGAVRLETDPVAAFAGADLVLVTVKCGAATEMGRLIARHAPATPTVISLQNGVRGREKLAGEISSGAEVVAGSVMFNVVQTREAGKPPRFHRATSGAVMIGPTARGVETLLDVPGLRVVSREDITGVLWSKLVLNMNNALNALSGLPLVEELADRRWRSILADHMEEALGVLRAAGIGTVRIEGVNPKLIPYALRLPTPLFRLVARRMLSIDPTARSSMWEDLVADRTTEIDYLQGAVIELAREHGRPAPIAERVLGLVKRLEGKGGPPPAIAPEQISGPAG